MDEDPGLDMWALDVTRFGPVHSTDAFLDMRTIESYFNYYQMHPPGKEAQSARPARCSPLHSVLAKHGAVFGSKFGHERPNWFSTTPGPPPAEEPSYTHPNWSDSVAAEHTAIREGVAMIDMSSFRKLEVAGAGALAGLNRMTVSDLDVAVGDVVYTQMCNRRGGIEADVTVARLGEDLFYVVTGSGFGEHDFCWIQRGLREQGDADATTTTTDVGPGYAVINLTGPRSRDVLAAVTSQPVDDEAFPFMTSRTLSIGLAAGVRALRVTFVGELGFELHVPAESAVYLYGRLWEAGQPHGIVNAGYRVSHP